MHQPPPRGAVFCLRTQYVPIRPRGLDAASAGPEGAGFESQSYWVNVLIARVARTYSNPKVRANGVELTFHEFSDDPGNGFFAGTLPDLSQGDSVFVEVDFPLMEVVAQQLQIPAGMPEFTVDPALPAPGEPIDPEMGPSSYDLTITSAEPSDAWTVAWLDSYDSEANLVSTESSIPENGSTRFIGGPISDVNGNRYPYLAFSAQYFVFEFIDGWHPDSSFLVYGSMAPWVTNLE